MPGRSIAAIDHILEMAHLFNTISLGEHFTVVNGVHQLAIDQNVERRVLGSLRLGAIAKVVDTQVEAQTELTAGRVNKPVGDVNAAGGVLGIEPEVARGGFDAARKIALDNLARDTDPLIALLDRPAMTNAGTGGRVPWSD